MGVSLGVPFCKLSGDGVENTSYTPGFDMSYKFYIPLNASQKSLLYPEAGFGVPIGTKQEYEGTTYKAYVSGIHIGLYYRQNFLEPELASVIPYAFGGLNLHALMADHPKLAIKYENETKVEELSHKVLFPELVFGVGFSFLRVGYAKLGIEIKDSIGLTTLNNNNGYGQTAGDIKSNVITCSLILKREW
jgi:hypothetical protein